MAVMARSLNIPARVAIGFLKPEPIGPDTYVYSAHDLHAWPELYFPGAGWVRFEPTPPDRATTTPGYTQHEFPEVDESDLPSSGATTDDITRPEVSDPKDQNPQDLTDDVERLPGAVARDRRRGPRPGRAGRAGPAAPAGPPPPSRAAARRRARAGLDRAARHRRRPGPDLARRVAHRARPARTWCTTSVAHRAPTPRPGPATVPTSHPRRSAPCSGSSPPSSSSATPGPASSRRRSSRPTPRPSSPRSRAACRGRAPACRVAAAFAVRRRGAARAVDSAVGEEMTYTGVVDHVG